MDFRLLGPLEVTDGERVVSVRGAKERALLAILLLDAGRFVPADRLIDRLWGDQPPETARNSLQVRVAGLRKALGRDRVLLRGTGYALRLEPGELDLERFEQLAARDDPASLREALAVWRGPALAEFADEEWAQPAISRLEELRLVALEQRIDAELELGLHGQVAAELEALTAEHPLRERLAALRMLALYRGGRQAEALDAYRTARGSLVETFGIEPGRALRELESQILRQDPALDPVRVATPPEGTILVAALDGDRLPGLLALAEPLVERPRRDLILFRPLPPHQDLTAASAKLERHRADLRSRGITARAAAFATPRPGADTARLAIEQTADLVLVDATVGLLADTELAGLLSATPCDVAMVVDGVPGDGHVLVPFTGSDHDWSAIEIAAWLARTLGIPLTVAGPAGPGNPGRMLASASLAVQRALDIAASPLLIQAGGNGLMEAARNAAAVVAGLSDRWQTDGLGMTRAALAAQARPPIIFVRRGLRPGGLAPPESRTRFTWSIAPAT